MEFSATFMLLLFCTTNIGAAVRPRRDPFMIYDERYSSSAELFPNECYGVPEFRPNTEFNFYFGFEDGRKVDFNYFSQQFERGLVRQKYRGKITPLGSIPSEFVKGCHQFWIKIYDDSFTSYECCESTGISFRLRKWDSVHDAILQGYVSKNCFEGTLCKPKPKPRCEKCRTDNGGLGFTLLHLHTKPGKYSGLFQILGGSGSEQAGLQYPTKVYVKGYPEKLFIWKA